MKFEIGSIERDSHECGELVKDYFARTIAGKDTPPLVFKWHIYKTFEDSGLCKLFVARDDDQIYGFALYIMFNHMHHDDVVVAQCDMIGVRPEMRGKHIGQTLIECAIAWFKDHGVTRIVHLYRVIYDTVPLFVKMGFELDEIVYKKEL